jgi:hypothetical protein
MRSVAVDLGPIVPWSGDTYRLIPSRFPPVAVYEGLVANDRFADLVEVENLTNPRLKAQERIADLAGEDPHTSARLQNWNHAPFAYGNPDGSIFFDELTPCLEVATDRQTALAVSVARRERFLGYTREPATGLDMRMLKTPVDGRFVDLRSLDPEEFELRGRELGAKLAESAHGILYRPIERPTATAISIVNAQVLGRAIQTVHFRFMWNGDRIATLYSFDAAGTEIETDDLRGEADCIAA